MTDDGLAPPSGLAPAPSAFLSAAFCRGVSAFAGFFTSSPRFGRTKPFDERKRLISACVHASLSASGGRTTLPLAPMVGEDMAEILEA